MGILSRFFPKKPFYDFFISYKSENVEIVRPIAEQLSAGGSKVWFGEYSVLLSDREDFMEAIMSGIRRTKYGICFTNDRYIRSGVCRTELEQLLNPANCGPQRTIEIKLPDEPLPRLRYPQLTQSPSTEYRSVNQTLNFIREVSTCPIETLEPMDSPRCTTSVFYYDNTAYSLDLTGWDVEHQKSAAPDKDGDVIGPKFRRWCGQDLLRGHLILGRQDKHILRKKLRTGIDDDREYFNNAISFAREFYGRTWRQKCVGVHLLFLDDLSHIALTTRIPWSWSRIWSRLYSVVLSRPNSYEDTEFAFFFSFHGRFSSFCRYAYYMDNVVRSLAPA